MPLEPFQIEKLRAAGADPVARCRCVNKPGSYMLLPAANRVEHRLPCLQGATVRVLASPQLGARFVEHELIIEPSGGTLGLLDEDLEQFLFVLEGNLTLSLNGDKPKKLIQGSYAWLPPCLPFNMRNPGEVPARLIWIRRKYEQVAGIALPAPILAHESDVPAVATDTYLEQHLTPYEQIGFDLGINLQTFDSGVYFSDVEAHVMEHGLYMLSGCGLYWLNRDTMEVQTGDFIYMAPYCPQFYYALGYEKSAYLLYKDVNRDPTLGL